MFSCFFFFLAPAAPADSKEPHAQVNPGGDIQVEFVQGKK